MWAAYVTYRVPNNLEEAVKVLQKKFYDLEWDCEHELMYGRNYFSSEYVQLKMENYKSAFLACDEYLENKIDILQFIEKLKQEKLDEFLNDLRNFVPEDVKLKLPLNADCEETIDD